MSLNQILSLVLLGLGGARQAAVLPVPSPSEAPEGLAVNRQRKGVVKTVRALPLWPGPPSVPPAPAGGDRHVAAAGGGLAGPRKKRRGGRSSSASAPPAPTDLCAVVVRANQVVGGDVKVLADAGRHEKGGVSMSLPDLSHWASLAGGGAPSGSRLRLRIQGSGLWISAPYLPWGWSPGLKSPNSKQQLTLASPGPLPMQQEGPWACSPTPCIHSPDVTMVGTRASSALSRPQSVNLLSGRNGLK